MGLLDQLLGGLTGQSSGDQQGSALLALATAVVQGHPGGLAGLVQQFTAAGLGREARSWVSTGENLPISAEQLSQVLGTSQVRELGEKFNFSPESASSGLASLLPGLIDHLTPKGEIDPEASLNETLGALRGRFNV
ncbi:MAG: YidB family protein [Candidatus Rokuibacteriota bacterium]